MKASRHRPPGFRDSPEKIILHATPNQPPSPLPPVRIFIGTEAAQLRAERVLVWSIEKVRNPSRVYEVYLMKELRGFDRRRWLTGFTNYRFAIPEFAGGSGRAIYNDVDQVYLTDPAKLFDLELGDHGFLTIAKNDSSVMLIDCSKMHSMWNVSRAQHERKTALLNEALAMKGLWGKLDPAWNARDDEYQEGQSKVLHYTALHTQPWHPFPEQFVYQESPVGEVWHTLHQQANLANFQTFDRQQPSSQFREMGRGLSDNPSLLQTSPATSTNPTPCETISEYITTVGAKSLLHYHLGQSTSTAEALQTIKTNHPSLPITSFDSLAIGASIPTQPADLVYVSGALSCLPDEDVGWVLQEIFSLSSQALYIEMFQKSPFPTSLPYLHSQERDFHWWTSQFQAHSSQYGHRPWILLFHSQDPKETTTTLVRKGGKWVGPPPTTWILSDGKVGHTTQCESLAQSLGWPYTIKHLKFNRWNARQKRVWSVLPPNLFGVNERHSDSIRPPWPDMVIAAGWRTAPIARWICQQSSGRTRSIQLGRNGGICAELFDVVVTPSYYHFLPHPNRIETLAPLNSASTIQPNTLKEHWPNLFNHAPHPRIVFVVGGSTKRFLLTADKARQVAVQLRELSKDCQGSIFAVTSPRTSQEVIQALEDILQPDHVVHRWKPNQTHNPYLAYLTGGDIIVVTGESESMLAEAASLGKPVYIIPVQERPANFVATLNEWIIQRAHSRPLNKRGTVRPQQGIEKICSRLLQSGLVQPRRDLTLLHQSLIQQGIALPFGEPLQNGQRPQLQEGERVAKRIQEVLGIVVDH